MPTAVIQRFLQSHPMVAVAVAVTLPTDQQVVQVVVAVHQVTVRQAIRQARHHLKATTAATAAAQETFLLAVAVVLGRQVEAEQRVTVQTVVLAATVQHHLLRVHQSLVRAAVVDAQAKTVAMAVQVEAVAVAQAQKPSTQTQILVMRTQVAAVAAVCLTTLQSIAWQAQADQVWSSFDT